jgi:hypothetical protein
MINRERGGGETRCLPQFFGELQLIPSITRNRPPRFHIPLLVDGRDSTRERPLTTIAILFGILPPLLLIYAIYKNDF